MVSTEELAFGKEAVGRALTLVVRKAERRARNNQRNEPLACAPHRSPVSWM